MPAGKRQPHCRGTFFLSIWHVCAQYSAPRLCLVIYVALSHLKVGVFLSKETQMLGDFQRPCSDARAPTPWRKASSSAAPASACMRERRETACIFLCLCAGVWCVRSFLTAWVSRFEMQHLQMCLVNCSPPASLPFRGDHWNKAIKVPLYMGARRCCECVPAISNRQNL